MSTRHPRAPLSQQRANELYRLAAAERRHSNHHQADIHTVDAATIAQALRHRAAWEQTRQRSS